MASKLNSFIENINIVANATKAATSDIVEDAQLAAEIAEAQALAANVSAGEASLSEAMSKEWAEKAYNSEITNNPLHYSSFHWSEVAKANAGTAVIFDNTLSTSQTWSSVKIDNLLNSKSNINHDHDGVYEEVFSKNSAFNKNFAGTGTSEDVAREDHTHANTYEPKRQTNGTAYNKDFGTGSGEVAEGSHTHTGVYMPHATPKSAYNKDFGTTIDTVAKGNHTHEAVNIGYDKSNARVVTSTLVQGAIDQLDGLMGDFTVSESTILTAGLSNVTEIPIAGISTPVEITCPLAVLVSKNCSLTSGASINVKYPIADTPDKQIEGTIIVSISTTSTEELGMTIAVDDIIQGEFITGTKSLTISKFLTNMDKDGFKIQPMIENRVSTNNIFITSMSVSWVGLPTGALVLSGASISHNDTTDRLDANAHPISAITGLTTELASKPHKPSSIVDGNFTAMDINGDLVDSGVHLGFAAGVVPKVTPAILDNITVQQTDGTLKDGGKKIEDLALKEGSATETFKVAVAVTPQDAVRKETIDNLLPTLSTKVELISHIADTNPHNVTPQQIQAAPLIHGHAQADITGLTDALNTKYDKVSGANQNNIPLFDTSGTLKDSGKTLDDIISRLDEINNWNPAGIILTEATTPKLSELNLVGALPQATLFPDGSIKGLTFNGDFIMYPNGMMEQWSGERLMSFSNSANLSHTWVFPKAYTPYPPQVLVTLSLDAYNLNVRSGTPYARLIGTTNAAIGVAGTFVSGDESAGDFIVGYSIGRWK